MPNLYELSDEELMNADESTFTIDEDANTDTTADSQDVELNQEPDTTEVDTETTVNNNESESTNTDGIEQTDNEDGTVAETETGTDTSANDTTEGTQADTESKIDYEEFYKEFTKPFKANGKEIQINNLADAKALMQQGVNYSKKMAQLKPRMGILKTLEANNLMDESELAFLIDLKNKNPEAIAKLVKDSEIDLYSFDTEQANNYRPQAQIVAYSDLEEVVNELQMNSQQFPKVLNDVINTWDEKSKQVLGDNPQILKIITEQAETGLYDKIVDAISYERMLGRMNGVSFLDAYTQIENAFVNAGVNTNTNSSNQPVNQTTQSNQAQAFTAPRPNTKPVVDTKTSEQKKKASTPNTTNNTSTETFNPLTVSDEELLKYMSQGKYH